MMYNGGPKQPELTVGATRQFMRDGENVIGIVLDTNGLCYTIVSIHGKYYNIAKTTPYKQVQLPFQERTRINKVRDLLMKRQKVQQDMIALELEEDRLNKELATLGF